MKRKIVVLGFMGACPIAGVIWQHVHYLVALARLGHDVTYVEDTATYPYDPVRMVTGTDFSYATEVISRLAERYGFAWGYCARFLASAPTAGVNLAAIRDLYRNADAILNICGSHAINEDLARSDRILYVESDPGVEQIKVDRGNQQAARYLARHRALFTFGESVPTGRFPVPKHGYRWIGTRQPVILDFWSAPPIRADGTFTTIANWSTSGRKDITWRGDVYRWSKAAAFLEFVEAPKRCGHRFELATDIAEPATKELFLRNGWTLVSPHQISIDWDAYRKYIQDSTAEFTVAKDQYVRLATGWFSDRSACYLAAGRPVITQETGFSRHLPSGKGLFAFSSLDDVRAAVDAIDSDYQGNCRAAREIAAEYFAGEKVVAQLLSSAGI